MDRETARESGHAYVAGSGAVSAFGRGRLALLDGVFSGHSGLRERRRLASVDCVARVLGELPRETLEADERELPLEMAVMAAEEAIGDRSRAGLGLVVSSTKADLGGVWGEGHGLGSPRRLADELAVRLSLDGPRAAVSCACASGLAAQALAGRWLRVGRVSRVLVVGTDGLNEFIVRGFNSLMALDRNPCRPYDRERRGLSLGEAAAALILTSDPAESSGVELIGWGASNDANHVTGPSRDGRGLWLAARRALEAAAIPSAEIDYVHLHGTGTRYNDASEALALARLFGGETPPASGTKSQTGHTLGATGLLESLVAIEALHRATAPMNVGLAETDVDPALQLPTAPTPLPRSRYALKVSAGFGGINAALVFERGEA